MKPLMQWRVPEGMPSSSEQPLPSQQGELELETREHTYSAAIGSSGDKEVV